MQKIECTFFSFGKNQLVERNLCKYQSCYKSSKFGSFFSTGQNLMQSSINKLIRWVWGYPYDWFFDLVYLYYLCPGTTLHWTWTRYLAYTAGWQRWYSDYYRIGILNESETLKNHFYYKKYNILLRVATINMNYA